MESPSETAPPRSWPLHLAAGWACAGLASAGFHLWFIRVGGGAGGIEWLADAVDLGRHLAFGLVSTLLVGVFRRFVPGPALIAWLAFGAVSLALGAWCLPSDMDGLAERLSEAQSIPSHVALGGVIVGIAGAVPGLAWLAHPRPFAASWRGRIQRGLHLSGVLALATLAFALNVTTSPGTNPSAHLYLSWATAVLLGYALPPMEVSWGGSRSRRWVLSGFAVLASIWGLWALFGLHSNTVMIQIARRPNALHLLASIRSEGGLDNVQAALAGRAGPFFSSRNELPPVPPSRGRPTLDRPIAIFVSFDSLRANVMTTPEQARYLTELARLMGDGATFTQARTPGSMTKFTLSSLSTGKYFSQQYWTPRGQTRWPEEDESVHFATLLSQAGVFTAAFPSARWLQEGVGILEGFQKSEWLGPKPPKRWRWVPGEKLTDALIQTLETNAERSGFYFVHYLDSHDPFDKVRKKGPKFTRYLESLRVVDGYLGRVREAVARLGLAERTLLIASADHGEAFGEHDSYFHGGSLYEELVRVPLAIAGPGVVPRKIDVPVSLIDLGPTLLDWFGLPTPAAFMGESLVPLMLGGERKFSRPIVAETGLIQSMVFADGFKAIRDLRRQTLELYDLGKDPLELANLSDSVDAEHEEHILLLRSFFQVHTFREHGYRVPYVK